MAADSDLAPGTVGVKQIPTAQLQQNPHNPRMLFDAAPLQALQESIAKVGILVPLTVYFSARKKAWVILDGQRRWMCAERLAMKTVPCNEVGEPSVEQNIITMFQIHKLRSDWELMPTALKLELLMTRLNERSDRRVAELTGLDQAQVSRCKKLLTFDRKYQDLMLHLDPGKRLKADFFIELHAVISDRSVKKMKWFKKGAFIDRMLEKHDKRAGLKSVTDFRIVKQRVTNAVKAGKLATITKRLEQWTGDDTLTLDHLDVAEATQRAEAQRIRKAAIALHERLAALDAERLYGEEELWRELEKLLALITKTLQAAGRTAVATTGKPRS